MPDPRNPLLVWIGAWGGLVGALIYSSVRSGAMLPINRALLAVVAALMMIWLLSLMLDKPKGRR